MTAVLFDTSVLVAAMVEAHPMHHRAYVWLKKAIAKEFDFVVCSHTLAELYAVLTRLPVSPRIPPGTAWRLIKENVETTGRIISLSVADYRSTIKDLSDRGLSGDVIYDALISRAAQKSKADRLLTFNPEDFKRVWPEGIDRLHVP